MEDKKTQQLECDNRFYAEYGIAKFEQKFIESMITHGVKQWYDT